MFWLKTGRLFDENDISVTISSRFQFAAIFCGGLFSGSLNIVASPDIGYGWLLNDCCIPRAVHLAFHGRDKRVTETILI